MEGRGDKYGAEGESRGEGGISAYIGREASVSLYGG